LKASSQLPCSLGLSSTLALGCGGLDRSPVGLVIVAYGMRERRAALTEASLLG
jgi:hypothetical protein